MAANMDNFVKEMMPIYTGLTELKENKLVGSAALHQLGGQINAILNNKDYLQIIGAPEKKLLSVVIEKNVNSGQVAGLATRVDLFSKLISASLIARNNLNGALAIASKIENGQERDALLNKVLTKLPLETVEDFTRAREIVASLKDPVDRDNVLFKRILPSLSQKYSQNPGPALLIEIFAVAKLISKDATELSQQWRENAFQRLGGFFSERPELKASVVNKKLTVEVMDPPDPNEHLQSIRRLIQLFKDEKAGLPGILQLINLLPDLQEKFAALQTLRHRDFQGDKKAEAIIDASANQLVLEIVSKGVEEGNFRAALQMVPRLPKDIRVKWEAAILDKAEKEIASCLAKGGGDEIEKADDFLQQFKISGDYVPAQYKAKWRAWESAIKAREG